MASAKSSGTTRRSSSSRGSSAGQGQEVSPARWAGVALVIAAIVGAAFLAMVSPSEPGEASQPGAVAENVEPTATPIPSGTDLQVPEVQPTITTPADGTRTREFEVAVSVDVPSDDSVPRKLLHLYVYSGDQIVDSAKPKTGTTVTVEGVRLTPGENTLTAALGGPGGPGPVSDPVLVTLDETAAKVEITSPDNKHETYDDGVVVEFTSEVGTTVRIVNQSNAFDQEEVIGPSGKASMLVRLKRGKNHILASSPDEAGQVLEDSVNVTRIDGRPTVKLKYPETAKPGETIRIVADVKDSKKKPMPEAEVHFSLGGPGRVTDSDIVITDESGRAVWNVEVTRSSALSSDTLELGVVVYSPSGEEKPLDRKITVG
jgi:hypothetical protein